jgi:ADP-ribose pyrophosphatase YjhB (NUDIX family)
MATPIAELTLEEALALPAFRTMEEIAVGAVILRRDGAEVLVMRRDEPAGGGLERLPRGTVAFDETVGDAVTRVVREQVGLAVTGVGDLWFGLAYEAPSGPAIELDYAVTIEPGPLVGEAGGAGAPGGTGSAGDWRPRWLAVDELRTSDLLGTVVDALADRLGLAGAG